MIKNEDIHHGAILQPDLTKRNLGRKVDRVRRKRKPANDKKQEGKK